MVRDDALVILLAGGAGERLSPLTRDRAKPAVYFGGPYRIIDFTLTQLHQLGAAPHLHRHAVQVAVAQPPHPHGLERRLGGARRVHRDPAAAEARRRALVPGHGRRRLPEPLLDRSARRRATSSCCPATTSTRWTTRRCCAFHHEQRRRRHARDHRGAGRRGRALRHRRRRRAPTASIGFQEKPAQPTPMPGSAARGAGVDGHLHLQRATCWCRRSRTTPPTPTASTTSARTSSRR